MDTLVTGGQVILEVWLPVFRQDLRGGKVEDCKGKDCQACQATGHSANLNCQDEKGFPGLGRIAKPLRMKY